MIKDEFIIIKGHPRNFQHYIDKGYHPQIGIEFQIRTKDLMSGSCYKITTICDKCFKETLNTFKDYYIYTNGLINLFYCNICNKENAKKTNLLKYGVDNVMKSDFIKNKLKNSINKKYGVDHYSMTDEYKDKYKSTCIEKYGVQNTFQVDLFKDQIKKTSNKKYGTDHFINLPSTRISTKLKKESKTSTKYESLLGNNFNIINYESDTFLINHKKCGEKFIIGSGLLRSRIVQKVSVCTYCNPIGKQSSFMEEDVSTILDINNIPYIKKDRSILKGKELDIYIPDYKIAIEINGVYWHSELYKDKNYHINKTKLCEENGIHLIHIWEDDWGNKKNIIKSILLNRLKSIPNKIYARNCIVKEVSSSISRKFLDNNHVQGFSPSQIKLGLFYDNELVSLMTFGFKYTNGKKEYELIRFCNKININVVGSASKLFKYFIKNNLNISKIISYSDISMFSGNMYEKLGFSFSHKTDPNYWWVVDGIRKHRFNYNKKKLIKMGYDPLKTEIEIMHELGYYRIYGCGQKKWIYENKSL